MPDFELIDVREIPYLYVTRSCRMDPDTIAREMNSAFVDVLSFMQRLGIKQVGPPLSVYNSFDPELLTFRSGFMVLREDLARADGEVKAAKTPAGTVLHFRHEGSYKALRDDYARMLEHVARLGRQIDAPTWEVFLNNPDQVPEDELLTDVYSVLA